MEAHAQLGPLSLLMKGETLPAGSRWEGSPARAVVTATINPVDAPRFAEKMAA
jgi:hypothetical protein